MEVKSEKIETNFDYSIVKEEYNYEEETSNPVAKDDKPLLQAKIGGPETFQCPDCPKTFGCKKNRRQHMKIHSKLKRYSCNVCKNEFKTLRSRNTHMKRHEMGLKFKCERCELEFFNYYVMLKHMKEVHRGDRYICKICKKGFSVKRNMRQHELRHTSQIQCYYCNKIVVNKQYLLRHIRNVHRGLPFIYTLATEDPAICTICSKSFKNLDKLKEHAKIHADERPFECAICGHTFTSKQRISVHMTKTHLNIGKPLPCLQCNKTFRRTVTFLAHHEKIHNNWKPFDCQVCSNKYRHQSHLAKHMRIHQQNRRDYTCKVCGLVLQYKKSLRNHERMHEKEADESTCSFCKKFFTYKRQLEAHVERYHRYLQCPYCEKKPGSQKFLDEHIRLHHKDPPKIKKEVVDKTERGVDIEILSRIKTEVDDSMDMIKQEDDVDKAVDMDISTEIKTELTEITEINYSITIKTEPN